jgi:hypothetical protein
LIPSAEERVSSLPAPLDEEWALPPQAVFVSADFHATAAVADSERVSPRVLHSSEPVVDFCLRAAESESAEVLSCWAVLGLCEQAADFRALRARWVVQPVDFLGWLARSFVPVARVD